MSDDNNDTSDGVEFQIDISAQDLVDKYGIEDTVADRIVADLPDLAKEWLKEPPKDEEEEDQEAKIPGYPKRPDDKYPLEMFAKRVRALMTKAGITGEMQTKVMEAISVDFVDSIMEDIEDVMEPISVDKPMMAMLKKILRRAKIPKGIEIKVMEAISVDEADWVAIKVVEEDVQEAISVDKPFRRLLLRILRRAKIPKEFRLNVMEAISVDEADVSRGAFIPTYIKKVRDKIKRLKLPKDLEEKVMEAISVDELGKQIDVLPAGMTAAKLTEEQKTKLTDMGLGPMAEAQVIWFGKLGDYPDIGSMQGKYPGPGSLDEDKSFFDSLDITFVKDSVNVEGDVLKAHAVCAAAMVQDYNGTKILKCPDELKLAVDFAKQLPITDGHPAGALVRDQKEVKGWTGLLTFNDELKRIECDVEITDSALIEKIQNGMTDVSIGFFCDLEHKKGTFKDAEGKDFEFDAIQRNIVLNHLATGVGQGRCPTGTCGIGQDSVEVDVDVGVHEKLLQEKVDALKALGTELSAKASTMTPEELQAKVSQMSEIAWNLRQMTDVINAKKIGVSGDILETTKDSLDAAEKIITDAKTDPDYNMALDFMEKEKARVIDSIMDLEPPKPRGFFEDMNIIALKDLKALMDSVKEVDGIDYSHSKKVGQDAVNEAYDNLFGN